MAESSLIEYHSEPENNDNRNESVPADTNAVSSPISSSTSRIDKSFTESRAMLEEGDEDHISGDLDNIHLMMQGSDNYVFVSQNENCDADSDVTQSTLHNLDDKPKQLSSTQQQQKELEKPLVHEQLTSMDEESPCLAFGGLNNLGNTCYMNSAIQMVASLDIFLEQIQKHIPIMEAEATEKDEETLRQTLISVLDRLKSGRTISPHVFKSKVDERSPLFIGFRQQDAHEFLTTLLDLLDEDYKKNIRVDLDEEMKDVQVDNNDEVMNDATASPVKKQRLDESQENTFSQIEIPSIPSTQSFKELEFEDIENLLHGDGVVSSESTTRLGKDDDGPRCKLVGGRMHTPGTAMTRWDQDDNVAEPPNNTRMMVEGDSTGSVEQEARLFSPVDEYFTTEVRVCLTCDSCKYRRSHTETYLHLSLEIGTTIASIEDGLRAFFKTEKREVKCEKCFSETASQTTKITKLPRALLFHLKRFIVDVSPDYSSISYRKNQTPVLIEPHLDMDENSGALGEVVATDEIVLPPNSRYTIRSVVNHIGSSASCGHYTADAWRTEDNEQREWIRFNDSYVSKISQTEAMENSATTAYMVLYELEPL